MSFLVESLVVFSSGNLLFDFEPSGKVYSINVTICTLNYKNVVWTVFTIQFSVFFFFSFFISFFLVSLFCGNLVSSLDHLNYSHSDFSYMTLEK